MKVVATKVVDQNGKTRVKLEFAPNKANVPDLELEKLNEIFAFGGEPGVACLYGYSSQEMEDGEATAFLQLKFEFKKTIIPPSGERNAGVKHEIILFDPHYEELNYGNSPFDKVA